MSHIGAGFLLMAVGIFGVFVAIGVSSGAIFFVSLVPLCVGGILANRRS